MRYQKSRKELLSCLMVGVIDTKRLLGISYPAARRVFDQARAIDEQELGSEVMEVFPTKVRTESVLKVMGITVKQCERLVDENV
jgi:hypothetical protein